MTWTSNGYGHAALLARLVVAPRNGRRHGLARAFYTTTTTTPAAIAADPEPATHYKITLRRSAIALGNRKQETLTALGLHRRMQTVYHAHTPEAAGKILKVKELVEVENVPASAVRTQSEQRWERRAPRGYSIGGLLRGFR